MKTTTHSQGRACTELTDGSRVGVVGGGPAGTLTSWFLLEMAGRVDLELGVDIYEPRDFSRPGPRGCNRCGGVVSESLVQMLAVEGINLPPSVVQRGLDSYVLHTEVDDVRIRTPLEEKRIASLHRGSGPTGARPGQFQSFDGFLLNLAKERGARHIEARVKHVFMENGRPVVRTREGVEQGYDLVVGAVGVNGGSLKLFEALGVPFKTPHTTKTAVCEFFLGREAIETHLGNAMHVFLLDLPGVEFAALIPKGEYVTVCVLGPGITKETVPRFLDHAMVRACFPKDCDLREPGCFCLPYINVGGARNFFADRVVLVGDCGTSRLYKDGIGAAYRAAKACAITAVSHGVSARDFKEHYWPVCRRLERDNVVGKGVFFGVDLFRRLAFFRRAVLEMTQREQDSSRGRPTMSGILWDTFTGSTPYENIVLRGLGARFLLPFSWYCAKALAHVGTRQNSPR